MLTKKQRDLLLFIHKRLKETGVCPSFDEMKDALDLASKSGIHRLITALEERGFLRRLPHKARALEVVKLPAEATLSAPPNGAKPFTPRLVAGSTPSAATAGGVAVPVMGAIAAGVPIEAIQDGGERVFAPAEMVAGGEHFALRVDGDSMTGAGILDGDVVILRRCDAADTGDIVVALVDQHEATLKRLRKKGGSIALEAANPAYETRIFGPDRVEVQGRLVGLIRQY